MKHNVFFFQSWNKVRRRSSSCRKQYDMWRRSSIQR